MQSSDAGPGRPRRRTEPEPASAPAPGLQRHARPVSRKKKLTMLSMKSSTPSPAAGLTSTSRRVCSQSQRGKFGTERLDDGTGTPRFVAREPLSRAVAHPEAAAGRATAWRPRPALREAMDRGSPTCRRAGRSVQPHSGSDDFPNLRRTTCTREQCARGGGGRAGKTRRPALRFDRLPAMAPSDDPPRRGKFVSGWLNRRRWPLRSAPEPL